MDTLLIYNLGHSPSPVHRYGKRVRRGRGGLAVSLTTIPMQSVHITINIVSSNPAHSDVYSIQHYVHL